MRERVAVLTRVLGNPHLRRVELAFLGFGCAEFGVWVAVLVYAFERGGTTTAAVIAVVQLLPAAVVAPLASRLVDRHGAAVALRNGYLWQALSLGVAALALLLDAPAVVVYAGAVLAASAVTLTRPAQGALLPALVARPAELIAANVVTGWVESVSVLAGPAIAGLLIAIDGPGAAVALFVGAVVASSLLVSPLTRAAGDGPEDEAEQPAEQGGIGELLRSHPQLGALLAVFAAQFVALGALDVLEVVLAVKVLGLGAPGAGYLGAAFGAGAVLGGVGTLSLVGRHRLTEALLSASAVWGVGFVVLGAWPSVAAAFGLLAAAGASHALLDVSGRTILHRVVPPPLHGRVFGLLEGLSMLGLALGSISVPALVDAGGAGTALAAIGGVLIVVAALTSPVVRRLESAVPPPEAELQVLRRSPLLSLLPLPVLEDLARALVSQQVAPGEVVVREGEPGERFYLIADGTFEVTVAGGRLTTVGAGDGFGEIALLRDGIRTATVTALGPGLLYSLDRTPFLEAVTGSPQAHRAAEEIVVGHLTSPRR
jgi:MFS family permease